MKNLLRFSLINTLAMLLLMTSRLPFEEEGIDWLFVAAIVLIIATWIHFFIEKNKLDKLK